MPKYRVTAPSGKVYSVNAPEGANQQQVMAYVRRMDAQSAPAKQSLGSKVRDIAGLALPPLTVVDALTGRKNRTAIGFVQGAANVGDKAAAKLEMGYNALAGATGLPKSTSGQNPAFSKAASKLGSGNKLGKTAGEIAAATFLTRRIPGAFGQGAASAAIMSDAKDPASYAMDVATGGAGGYVGNRALNALTGAIAPQVSNAARYLHNRGVRLTPGQASQAFQRTEERLTSRPFIGDRIAAGRQQSYRDFNRVAIQDTLTPIGAQLPDNVQGREAVRYAGNRISAEYERLIPQLRLRPDAQLATDIQGVHAAVNNGDLSPQAIQRFNAIIQNQVTPRLNGTQPLDGQAYRLIERNLGRQMARFGRSQEPDNQALADAFEQLQTSFQTALQRSNPTHSARLGELNESWANLVRVEGASSAARAPVFAPGHLWSAVKRADNSVRGRAVGRGEARMQELADAGVDVLPSDYPDSGTSGRAQMNPFDPRYWLGAGQSLLYGPGAQQTITNALLAPRPQAAQSIADLLGYVPAPQIGSAATAPLSPTR